MLSVIPEGFFPEPIAAFRFVFGFIRVSPPLFEFPDLNLFSFSFGGVIVKVPRLCRSGRRGKVVESGGEIGGRAQ